MRTPWCCVPMAALWMSCGGGASAVKPLRSEPAPANVKPAALSAAPKPATASGPSTPAWAAQGDGETDESFRFICQGEGDSAEAATTTARAFCEDKICKLCGVEVESVVRSTETLSGVELSRQVVERCRRVRTETPRIKRQSLDCPSTGRCIAWIEIEYSKAQRRKECRRYTEELYADPEECEKAIDGFQQTRGYTAASFRTRIALLERARSACQDIDVRPTPLLNALDEKLRRGMATFTDERGRAPRYLARHWLADHPPMWDDYKTVGSFPKKLDLLLSYLRSKPPILDIIEQSLLPPEQLDTPTGHARLLELLKRTAADHGYGLSGVHFFALDRVRQLHRKNMYHQPLASLWTVLTERYPPAEAGAWSRVVGLTWLASVDGTVTNSEWSYFANVPRWWARAAQMLLAVDDHGSTTIKKRRFQSALERALQKPGVKAARATRRVLPNSMLMLDVEALVPSDARSTVYSFDALKSLYSRLDDRITATDRNRLFARMLAALNDIPAEPKSARRHCTQLSKRLEFLEQNGIRADATDRVLCPCLTDHLRESGLSLVNKSELYRRALDRNLSCVAVKAKAGSKS